MDGEFLTRGVADLVYDAPPGGVRREWDEPSRPTQGDLWRAAHTRRIFVTDLAALLVAVALAFTLRFGDGIVPRTHGGFSISYVVLGFALVAGWMITLTVNGSRDRRVIANGLSEYRLVADATVYVFGILAIVTVLFKVDIARGYLAVALPAGMVLLMLGRKAWRVWLRHQRLSGRAVTRVLLLGGRASAQTIGGHFQRNRGAGMQVAAVWVPDGHVEAGALLPIGTRAVPVFGTARTLPEVLAASRAELVIVTDSEHLGHRGLNDLTWDLENTGVELMVSPNVVHVSNGRLNLTTVASMPLLHIAEPQYAEAAAWPKLIFDRAVAGALILLLSPLLIATAIAVRLSSPGPVFYYQERIGRDGRPFRITKFRSMRDGADAHLQELLRETGKADSHWASSRTTRG